MHRREPGRLYRDGRRAEALRVVHECRTMTPADRSQMVRLVDVLPYSSQP